MALALVALEACVCSTPKAEKKALNPLPVILISIDTERRDHLYSGRHRRSRG